MSEPADIEFQIARLELEPGDILAVRPKAMWSYEQVRRFQEVMARAVPGLKCLVLEAGMELSIVTPAPSDQALASKTDDELRQMIAWGEISPNQVRRAQAMRAVVDPIDKSGEASA